MGDKGIMIGLLRRLRDFLQEKQLMRAWARLPPGDPADVNPNFQLTYDVLGIKNKYPLYCRFCDLPMVVRSSRLDWSVELNSLNTHIDLALKCPRCDWWTPFGVAVPPHYFIWLWRLRKRHGIGRTYAPTEQWQDDARVKQRLEALGYW